MATAATAHRRGRGFARTTSPPDMGRAGAALAIRRLLSPVQGERWPRSGRMRGCFATAAGSTDHHDLSRLLRESFAPFRHREGRRRGRPRHPRGRVLRHARAVRLGQDDLPAADRRLRTADRRPPRSSANAPRASRPTAATSTPCSRTMRSFRISTSSTTSPTG